MYRFQIYTWGSGVGVSGLKLMYRTIGSLMYFMFHTTVHIRCLVVYNCRYTLTTDVPLTGPTDSESSRVCRFVPRHTGVVEGPSLVCCKASSLNSLLSCLFVSIFTWSLTFPYHDLHFKVSFRSPVLCLSDDPLYLTDGTPCECHDVLGFLPLSRRVSSLHRHSLCYYRSPLPRYSGSVISL